MQNSNRKPWSLEASIEAGALLAAGQPHNKSREWVEAALGFDPFMGDFGDGTERVFKDELAVALRGGRCMCGDDCRGTGRVNKGELARVIRRVDGDGWYGGRVCVRCLDAEGAELLEAGELAQKVREGETVWTEDDGWGE